MKRVAIGKPSAGLPGEAAGRVASRVLPRAHRRRDRDISEEATGSHRPDQTDPVTVVGSHTVDNFWVRPHSLFRSARVEFREGRRRSSLTCRRNLGATSVKSPPPRRSSPKFNPLRHPRGYTGDRKCSCIQEQTSPGHVHSPAGGRRVAGAVTGRGATLPISLWPES